MALSTYEQNTLEMGCHLGSRGDYERTLRMATTEDESEAILKLDRLKLIDIHGMNSERGVMGFLFALTGKGDAVMRLNWKKRKK